MNKKILIAAISLILILIGLALPTPRRAVKAAVQDRWLVLSGRLVDVGGHRLRIDCMGMGSPTVVFDAGLNLTRRTWDPIVDDVAKISRACTYDRAGLGESDPAGQRPRTSHEIANDLDVVLTKSGEKGPFVLVGHSFGGINIRLYASEHPDKVVGLVLIDPSQEDQVYRYSALMPSPQSEEFLRHESGGNFEGVDIVASSEELRTAAPPPGIPMIVLTALPPATEDQPIDVLEQNKAFNQAKLELHGNLVRALPQARQIIVEGSSHFIQRDRPDLVTDSIASVVQAFKQGRDQASSLLNAARSNERL